MHRALRPEPAAAADARPLRRPSLRGAPHRASPACDRPAAGAARGFAPGLLPRARRHRVRSCPGCRRPPSACGCARPDRPSQRTSSAAAGDPDRTRVRRRSAADSIDAVCRISPTGRVSPWRCQGSSAGVILFVGTEVVRIEALSAENACLSGHLVVVVEDAATGAGLAHQSRDDRVPERRFAGRVIDRADQVRHRRHQSRSGFGCTRPLAQIQGAAHQIRLAMHADFAEQPRQLDAQRIDADGAPPRDLRQGAPVARSAQSLASAAVNPNKAARRSGDGRGGGSTSISSTTRPAGSQRP